MYKLKKIVFEIDKAIIFLSFALLLFDKTLFLQAFGFENALVLKMFILFQCYVFLDELMRVLQEIRYFIPKIELEKPKVMLQKHENYNMIDGICTNSLVDYIFESGKMAYEDMRGKFNITPQKYKKLGQNLEKINILKRGKNNARVLKQPLDKFETLKHISKFSNSDNLTALLRWDGGNAVVV